MSTPTTPSARLRGELKDAGALARVASYAPDDLKKNRAAVLIYGGTEADRQAFASQAAQALAPDDDARLFEVSDEAVLTRALGHGRGVVYVADATRLSNAMQRDLVRALRELEERPKLVLGLPITPELARERGLLREDLAFWLRAGTVDLRESRRKER